MEQTTLQGAQHRRKVGSQDEAKKSETILRHRNIQMKHLVFEIVKVVLETLNNILSINSFNNIYSTNIKSTLHFYLSQT